MSTEPAPTGQDDTTDLVTELRQRVQRALDAYEAAKFAIGDEGGDCDLGAGLREIQPTLDPADPVVQAVARALIGQGVSYTLQVIFGGPDHARLTAGAADITL